MTTVMQQTYHKLIYRELGKKDLSELHAPVETINDMIRTHAGVLLSPDCGKSWIVFGGGDWDYYFEIGTYVPPIKKFLAPAPEQQKLPAPATAPAKPMIAAAVSEAFTEMPTSAPARREEDKFNIPLICSRSGLFLGKFIPSNGLAVATPYVTAWKQTAFLHPIFSLSFPALLHRARSCWELEKNGKRNFPMQHKQLLFLAMLHASGCIRQDVAALPNPKITEVHFMRVLEMLYWKHETASDRVHFPRLHVWEGADKEDRTNVFKQVPIWLDFCEVAKDEYENVVRERQKAAKVKAKELALKSIRKNMYADVSLRRLWNWVEAQVPQIVLENNPDLVQLFFCEESKIHAWTTEDIEALEDMVLKHCELGNSVSFEVNKRIRQLAEQHKIYHSLYEVVDSSAFSEYKGMPAPKIGDYKTKTEYLIAVAQWELANKSQWAQQVTATPGTARDQKPATAKNIKITGDDL